MSNMLLTNTWAITIIRRRRLDVSVHVRVYTSTSTRQLKYKLEINNIKLYEHMIVIRTYKYN